MKRPVRRCVGLLLVMAALGAILAAAVPQVSSHVRASLGLSLTGERAADGSSFPVLVAHNFAVCAWPLALRVLRMHRSRFTRITFGIPVVVALIANGALVGLALGTYGLRLLPFLPHLPIEWAALVSGCAGWFMEDALRPRWIWVLVGVLVATAAAIETWAAPL